MYKVFINDKPIILTDSMIKTSNFLHFSFENAVLDEVIHKLKYESLDGVVLLCKELDSCWQHFVSHFKKVVAAGGLVVNQKKEFLFIYRGNKWDLPKGRIEEGESLEQTALREVEEECGTQNLELQNYLLTTYHLFSHKNRQKLKETHWYLMQTNSEQNLTPQWEEGITQVAFKNTQEKEAALENTYANIKLVFEAYFEKA